MNTSSIVQLTDPLPAAPLFTGWEETLIYSCLQGLMGCVWADDPDHPSSALALLGDFGFVAGQPNSALACLAADRPFLILTPQNEDWSQLIEETFGDRAHRRLRYAIKKEPGVFDREHLEKLAESLPPGYVLHRINRGLYKRCQKQDWSRDLTSQFPSYEDFRRLGLGIVVTKGRALVAGASSYARYLGGIEIEVDTREDHRRQGLASACCARLILECLSKKLYPSWDAQNTVSVALAEKLGYHFDREYPVYEITAVGPETHS